MDNNLIEQMRDKFDIRRAVRNFVQIFLIGYITIGALLLAWIAGEEGWGKALTYVTVDSATSNWLLFLPALFGFPVACARGIVRPDFDISNESQWEAYIEAQKWRYWPKWQKGLVLLSAALLASLPFFPDLPVSDESLARMEKEAETVKSLVLNEKLAEIWADGVVTGAEFNEFMLLSLSVQAKRF